MSDGFLFIAASQNVLYVAAIQHKKAGPLTTSPLMRMVSALFEMRALLRDPSAERINLYDSFLRKIKAVIYR